LNVMYVVPDVPSSEGAGVATIPPAPVVVRVVWGYRRVPLSYGRHHGGRVTLWPGGPSVRVESHEEACVVRGLVASGCERVTAQPVTIWYRLGGRMRRYTPDLDVQASSARSALRGPAGETRFLVEVRPVNRLRLSPHEWTTLVAVVLQATGLPLILLSASRAGGRQ
jgi:hypothetical protein